MKVKLITTLILAAVIISLGTGVAFAWSYLGSFSGAQFWSPNSGEKWAQFVEDNWLSRYLDVEAYNFRYSSQRIEALRSAGNWTSIVYHAFRQDTNCFVNVTAIGYWWTNYPYPSLETKSANCSGENFTGHNEVRIWNTDPYGLVANYDYYAGAEYKDRSYERGGARLGGEMNYDAYKCALPGCKEWLSKFYFNSSNQFQ